MTRTRDAIALAIIATANMATCALLALNPPTHTPNEQAPAAVVADTTARPLTWRPH